MKDLFYKNVLLLPTALFAFLLQSVCSSGQSSIKADSSKAKNWFPKYDFNITSFKKPAIEFAPFARWWWPGNNVDKDELKERLTFLPITILEELKYSH